MKKTVFIVLGALSGFFITGSVLAKEVKTTYNKLTLNANLEIAKSKQLQDGVILMTHAGLAHGRMDTLTYIQQLFKDHGYSSLAITLSLGIDNRHGMLDCGTTHRHGYADAADEIDVWLNWLQQKNVKQVVLLGHSRGAAQTALYAAEHENKLVRSVVLLAPDTKATNDAKAYQRRHKRPLEPVLLNARKLVSSGKGNTILKNTGILYCQDTSVSAETIVSYYGDDPRLDAPYVIPKIKTPTLILIAGGDDIVVGHKEKFLPLKKYINIQVDVVDDADHFFRDLFADEAVDKIVEFLKTTNNF